MNIINGIIKRLYWPICRAYARSRIDKPATAFLRLLCTPEFYRTLHYWPNFKNPITFNEKIWHRMFFDRNPILTKVSDKLLVRDYVSQRDCSNYLIPLLWQGDAPDDIPFDELPEKFVIKANHGCGYNIIVKNKSHVSKLQIRKQLSTWLKENFCEDKYLGLPWAYKNIRPKIIIEKYIGVNDQLPIDYKFFCYGGRAEYVLMTFDRYTNTTEKHFDRDFNPLDLWNGAQQYSGVITKPSNFDQLLGIADTLSTEFDFIRVDLYSLGTIIYFGELTCYPAGGMARFIPEQYDSIFGYKWHINSI